MNFLDLVNSRQSVRRYTDQVPSKASIERCLEAARLAPSASNSQPWTFIVIDKEPLRKEIAQLTYSKILTFNKFVSLAPVLIAIVLEKPKVVTQIGAAIKKKEYPLIDIGIAAEHICLQAVEEGLGTCMIGWFQENKIKKLLDIPVNKNIGLLITLGYAPSDYKTRNKTRKSKNDVIKYNSYNS